MTARRGLFRTAFVSALVAALTMGRRWLRLLMTPDRAAGPWIQVGFYNLTGYTSPPAYYTNGDTFTISFDVRNDFDSARDACFRLEVYKLGVSPATNYTEAQLETMVNTTNVSETLVGSKEFTVSFAAHTQKTVSTGMAVAGPGYYQFDLGFCGTGPFTPRPGYAGPPVSGFVRYLPVGGVGGLTITPTAAPTAAPAANHSTSAAQTGTLANTGGGPSAAAPWLVAFAGMVSPRGRCPRAQAETQPLSDRHKTRRAGPEAGSPYSQDEPRQHPHRLAARTRPFQGCNGGSIPPGGTIPPPAMASFKAWTQVT